MVRVEVKIKDKNEDMWFFDVILTESHGKTNYIVEVEKAYYEKLTEKKVKPGKLVRISFEFLLIREPPKAIIKEFNLKEISRYFPEYEEEMIKKFH